MEILSHTENDTKKAAENLAIRLKFPQIITLEGALGMGKSVFARALIRKLTGNADEEVPSPTFTLVQTYETPAGVIWHFDLYRLKTPEEIYELGWEEALSDGLMIIEWPERLGELAPQKCTRIKFENSPGSQGSRMIHISQMPERF